MKKIFSLLAVFVFLLAPFNVSADSVKVDHLATRVEKLKEKITLFFKFNKSDKANYYQYLVEKRLGEMTYVIENNKIDLVEETASRYATYLGQLTDYVRKNNLSGEKSDLLEIFERHTKIISESQKKFKYDSGWWLAIQHDLNTIIILKDQIKNL